MDQPGPISFTSSASETLVGAASLRDPGRGGRAPHPVDRGQDLSPGDLAIFETAEQLPTAPKRIVYATLGLIRAHAIERSAALELAAAYFKDSLKPTTRKKAMSEARALLTYGSAGGALLASLGLRSPIEMSDDAVFRAVGLADLRVATEIRARRLRGARGGRPGSDDARGPLSCALTKSTVEGEYRAAPMTSEQSLEGRHTLSIADRARAAERRHGPRTNALEALGHVRVTGEISIDIEATSFAEAALEQERLESVMRIIQEQFPNAALTVRERRRSRGVPTQVAPTELVNKRDRRRSEGLIR